MTWVVKPLTKILFFFKFAPWKPSHNHHMFILIFIAIKLTQLVTTKGCVQGTLLSPFITSLHVAFLNWLSSLNFGPSHVNRKQYGRSINVLLFPFISIVIFWHLLEWIKVTYTNNIIIVLWFSDLGKTTNCILLLSWLNSIVKCCYRLEERWKLTLSMVFATSLSYQLACCAF